MWTQFLAKPYLSSGTCAYTVYRENPPPGLLHYSRPRGGHNPILFPVRPFDTEIAGDHADVLGLSKFPTMDCILKRLPAFVDNVAIPGLILGLFKS